MNLLIPIITLSFDIILIGDKITGGKALALSLLSLSYSLLRLALRRKITTRAMMIASITNPIATPTIMGRIDFAAGT